MTDQTLQIPLAKIADLAVEHWRLTQSLGPVLERSSSAPIRHSLRKMEDLLKFCEIEIQSFDGQPYDPGLAARVVDSVVDLALEKGQSLIVETVSPLVLHKHAVLRPADVIISTNV